MSFPLSPGLLVFYIYVALVVVTVIMVPVVVLVWLRDRSKSKYDNNNREIKLSAMRNNYESQIAELSARLTATEERWQEVNHLILASQDAQADAAPAAVSADIPLLAELGLRQEDIVLDEKLVFVLTPFADSEDDAYRSIKYACEILGLTCMRGDEEYAPGYVLPHIVRLIAQARIVIANVGSRNPNVFYELGIAHTIGKATILVGKTIEEVPFDIRTKRVITYSAPGQLQGRVQSALRQVLNLPSSRSAS